MPPSTTWVLLVWWETPQLWKDSQMGTQITIKRYCRKEEQIDISCARDDLAELSREQDEDTEEEDNDEDIERGDNDEDIEDGVVEGLGSSGYQQDTGSLETGDLPTST